MKQFLLFTIAFFAFSFSGYSQTFDDFVKSGNAARKGYVADKNQEYNKYLEKINKEFAEYLKEKWTKFDVKDGTLVPSKPKPVEPVSVSSPDEVVPVSEQVIYEQEVNAEDLEMSPEEEKNYKKATDFVETLRQSEINAASEFEKEDYTANVLIYNTPVNICCASQQLSDIVLSNINESQVGEFWSKVMKADNEYVLAKCQKIRADMKLNDWGYYLICKKAAENIFKNGDDEKTLYTVFLLCQSGYSAKIGRCNERLIVLLPFYQNSYCQKYVECDDVKYYMFNFDNVPITGNNVIYTYEKVFNKNYAKRLNLLIDEEPQFNENIATITLRYGNNSDPMTFMYNSNLMDYYKDYPLVDLKVYFNAAISRDLNESIKTCLTPLVKGKSEQLSVNTLLDFMYTSFDNYKNDDEQFGHEKWFFCEEMLYYPYNDCEDRAVFFANVVSTLLGLDVVLLEYKTHVATAVRFNDEVKGKYLLYNDKKYVVCDPTYFGAYAGIEMPEMGEPVVISR